MSDRHKLLFAILVLFILLDILLFIQLFPLTNRINTKLQDKATSPPSQQSGNVKPLQELSDGEIRILPASPKELALAELALKGYVYKPPSLDENDQTYKMIVNIPLKDGAKNSTNFSFVLKEQKILSVILTEKNRNIQVWEDRDIPDIYPYLKENTPVIISIFFDKNAEILLKNKDCNDYCKKLINESIQLYKNDSVLIDIMTGKSKNKIGETLEVGPVSTLIIFEK